MLLSSSCPMVTNSQYSSAGAVTVYASWHMFDYPQKQDFAPSPTRRDQLWGPPWCVSDRCSRLFSQGSTSCVPRSRNCIICVPRCPLHVCQLRPELSTPNGTSCVPRLVRNCISCIERYGCTKCPTIGRFLHSFIVLYFIHNYMHTYRIVEWYRHHSCYIVSRSNV
jgi:hypothetical protein